MTRTEQHPIGSPFTANSTAADVMAGLDLSGTSAVVTRGYSGLGLETTRALTAAGAHIIVPARRPEIAPASSIAEMPLQERSNADGWTHTAT